MLRRPPTAAWLGGALCGLLALGAAAAVADAQVGSTPPASCADRKVSLPGAVLERTGGIDVPVLVDVHTADLSVLPGAAAAAAPTAELALAAVQPVYAARLITIGTLAGAGAEAATESQQRASLDATLPAGAPAWAYEGTLRLVIADATAACALAALPEVDRVTSVPALLEVATTTGAAAVSAAAGAAGAATTAGGTAGTASTTGG